MKNNDWKRAGTKGYSFDDYSRTKSAKRLRRALRKRSRRVDNAFAFGEWK